VECKDRYLAELFHKPAPLLEIEEVDVVPEAGARVIHAVKKPVMSRSASTTKKKVSSSKKRVR
jgi:hypothetical protein